MTSAVASSYRYPTVVMEPLNATDFLVPTAGFGDCDGETSSNTSDKEQRRQVFKDSCTTMGFAGRPFYGRKQELACLAEIYSNFVANNNTSPTSNPGYRNSKREDSKEFGVNTTTTRAIFIRGVSGCGKTALVQQFVKQLRERNVDTEAPQVLQGKYEEMRRQDPFSAVEQAFGNYMRQLNMTISEQQKVFIINAIGGTTGLDVLKDIIPVLSGWTTPTVNIHNLDDLDGSKEDRWSSQTETNLPKRKRRGTHNNNAFKSNQLHYVFGKLVQALTRVDNMVAKSSQDSARPVLLILDDLQWADSASLDLLAYLVKKAASLKCPFFLVCTYRSEEERWNSHLSANLLLAEQTKDFSFELSLENHSQGEITEMLTREMNADPMQCEALATTIYQRTKGNFFFTWHLVEDLQRQEVLRKHHRHSKQKSSFNSNSFRTSNSTSSSTDSNNSKSYDHTQCTWNAEDIVQFVEQSTSHTVVDTVADKISHLPNRKLRQALVLASYLGSQFDVSILHAALVQAMSQWGDESTPASKETKTDDERAPISRSDLIQILDVAVLEGLLYNAVGSTTYTFAHDRIQEAASNMVPVGPDRDQLLYRMGLFLKEQAAALSLPSDQSTDWMLFLAARHWSQIDDTLLPNFMDPLDLARLYLECGEKAISMTAFKEAARCFRSGLDSVPLVQVSKLWVDHYDLALQLYRLSAEMELLLGNFEEGYSLGNSVLQNAKTLLEKISTYNAMEAALGLQERHDEALALNMEVLKAMDQVPSLLYGIRDFFQVKSMINNTSDEEILNLPELTDPALLAASICLGNAAVRAFVCGNMLLMITITLKGVKDIEKHGLSAQTPLVLAGYGCALLAGMGHPDTGRRMGRLAIQLASHPNYNDQECKALYIVASQIELWTESYTRVIETYERANKVGLMSGNLDYAYGAENEAILTSFVTGKPLSMISERFHRLRNDVVQYNLDALTRVLNPFGTLLSHLGRDSSDVDSVSEESSGLDWDDFDLKEELRKDSANHHTLTWATLYGMILSFLMNDTEAAQELTEKFHRIVPAQSFFVCSLGSFYSGLVSARLAHKSKLSKHKNLARKYTKELNKIVLKGCTKVEHLHLLLKAECLSFDKPNKQSLVQLAYGEAIASAKDKGHINDEALANELTAEYFLRRKRPHAAKDFLVKACSLYLQWGACRKVDQLLQKHDSYLTRDDLESLPISDCPVTVDDGFMSVVSSTESSSAAGDDVSTLNPIPEYQSLGNVNRWATGGSHHNRKGGFQTPGSPPPKPVRRSDDPTPPIRKNT